MSSKLRPDPTSTPAGSANPTKLAGTPPGSGNLRAALGDPAFQDQLQRLRRAGLATGVLEVAAVARVEVEDPRGLPDRHAVLDPAVASPATAAPKPERT
jgi:hypothetical protein